MSKNVPYGGSLVLNMRLTPKARYDRLSPNQSSAGSSPGSAIGRAASFNASYMTASGSGGNQTATLQGFNSQTFTPYGESNFFAGYAGDISSVTGSLGCLAIGSYGPNMVSFCIPPELLATGGNQVVSLIAFSELPLGSPYGATIIDNIKTGLDPSLYQSSAMTRNALAAFSFDPSLTTSTSISFFLNQPVANTLDARRISIGYAPGYYPKVGNGLILMRRDPADLHIAHSGSTIGIPAITTDVQGRSARTFTYGVGQSGNAIAPGGFMPWNIWTDSVVLPYGSPSTGPLSTYRIYNQTVRDSQDLNFLNPSVLITYIQAATLNQTRSAYFSTPWGFSVVPPYIGNNDAVQSRMLLIAPDASAWYDVVCMYNGNYASAFINTGIGASQDNTMKLDNNGALYYYNKFFPAKVLVADDVFLSYHPNGYSLPVRLPYSMPCLTNCMADGSALARLNK
jgi:hypothetical protein